MKLRFFAGLSIREAAATLGIAASTADRDWAYAKGWLRAGDVAASDSEAETEILRDSVNFLPVHSWPDLALIIEASRLRLAERLHRWTNKLSVDASSASRSEIESRELRDEYFGKCVRRCQRLLRSRRSLARGRARRQPTSWKRRDSAAC